MRPARARQQQPHCLLRARLADGAGNGDDPRLRARPCRPPEILHRGERIGYDEERAGKALAGGSKRLGPVARDHGGSSAFLQGLDHEVMSVARLTGDGEEQITRFQAARVDGDTLDARRQRTDAAGLHRRARFLACP